MTLAILLVEDESEVRYALERDLEDMWQDLRLEVAETADDAWEACEDVDADGDELAVVLADHRLPGRTGVDFLVQLNRDERFRQVRTCLVTGQADQADTIRALNEGGLDRYIAKPWDAEHLRATVRDLLTEYVVETGADPLPVLRHVDAARVTELLR